MPLRNALRVKRMKGSTARGYTLWDTLGDVDWPPETCGKFFIRQSHLSDSNVAKLRAVFTQTRVTCKYFVTTKWILAEIAFH